MLESARHRWLSRSLFRRCGCSGRDNLPSELRGVSTAGRWRLALIWELMRHASPQGAHACVSVAQKCA